MSLRIITSQFLGLSTKKKLLWKCPCMYLLLLTIRRILIPLFYYTKFKGEVHSRMAIYFLYANKKFIQKYVIHQNFSFQRALNPYEIFL